MLKVKNLKVKVENKNILKGISFELKAGEVQVIMGPNGSGKSSLASVLAGNQDFEVIGGQVFFEKQDLLSLSAEDRARQGVFLAFQYPIAIPGVSMVNFLKASLNQVRQSQGLELLDYLAVMDLIKEKAKMLDLGVDFLNRSVNHGFSGGEKKKNEILQMMVLNPKLIILDEIDSGLDVDALKLVAKAIRSFKTKDKAILIITHYQQVLNYIKPDKIHVMVDGQMVKSGDKLLAQKIEKQGYDWLKKNK